MLMLWLVLWVICMLKAGLCRTTYRTPITISWVRRTQNIQQRWIMAAMAILQRTVQAMGWRSGRIGAESRRCLIMQNRRAYPLQTLICSWAFYGKNCRDTQQ